MCYRSAGAQDSVAQNGEGVKLQARTARVLFAGAGNRVSVGRLRHPASPERWLGAGRRKKVSWIAPRSPTFPTVACRKKRSAAAPTWFRLELEPWLCWFVNVREKPGTQACDFLTPATHSGYKCSWNLEVWPPKCMVESSTDVAKICMSGRCANDACW